MSSANITNHAASVYARLKNISRVRKQDFNRLLVRYAIERFLYRLGVSGYNRHFVLKGGNLFVIWQNGDTHRTTMDSDFLFFGDASGEHLRKIFSELAANDVCPEDGMRYVPETIVVSPIREGNEYGGTRISLKAFLGTACVTMQFDIGIGDVVTPGPESSVFPVLLPLPAPRIRTYPAVTAIAEKVDNMIIRELDNSRMKDFYDIWLLSMLFQYDLMELHEAICNTLCRRGTGVPRHIPAALSEAFAGNRLKQVQWKAFLRRSGLSDAPQELHEVISRLAIFLLPALQAKIGHPAIWDNRIGAWNYGSDIF